MHRILLLAANFLFACSSSVKDIIPQFKSGFQPLIDEISKEIPLRDLTVSGKLDSKSGEHTSRNLEIILIDAQIKYFNRAKLDSLSGRISEISKEHIANISAYDWVTIIYNTSDGSRPSDSTEHNVFVIRPNEIKGSQPNPIRRT